jgi:acetyltransferase-like isoleucine patch superfamily enzyme/glycosyltransferase involved in cell wall biosynthesis
MLDVLILTHNEELNIPHALAAVRGLAAQIFVIDSGSTDQTATIAQAAGATVVQRSWSGYAAQRNWALDNLPLTAPWILILDADEALTPALADEIRAIVSRPPESVRHSAFFLNRVLIFMGREIRHCGYFPSWNLRLFKRGSARYEERQVHEHLVVDGTIGYLKNLIRHEDRRGLEHYVAKHNRYSTLEARELYLAHEPWPGFRRFLTDRVARRRFVKYRVATKIMAPWFWRFIYMYFFRFGFLDREAGINFCLFISTYELLIRMKYRDIARNDGRHRLTANGLALPEGSVHPLRQNPPEPTTALAALPPPAVLDKPRRVPQRRTGATMRQKSPWSFQQKIERVVWGMVQGTVFQFSPHNAYAWRSMLLRMFGARIGKNVRIRRSVHVEIPWNLAIGDHSIVGDHAILYCLGKVTLGSFVTISQYAHLCAGTHETHSREMALLRPPIAVGDDVWIAADAFVGPGVTIGDRTILGARASAFTDLPPDVVAVGNPAKPIKPREFHRG